jgi:nitrate/TMAO reductase-like tetraheme cytochrome c subunit
MARISLAGFKDPKRRPRFIVWSVVAVLVIILVMIPVLGVTSTRWFCAEGCHKVQDDTITAYNHSPHSEISCMACHMPVQANPVVFLLHKAEALGELYMTVTNKFELPLNGESEVALTMKTTQCTQCHDEEKRTVTPSPGLKINHAIHAKDGITCTTCHNRTAHVEDFKLTLVDPTTGKPNRRHEDFMKMTACFRCHSQDSVGEKKPTGACEACHTPGFELKPPSHLLPGFFPKGHGKLGAAEESRTLASAKTSWLNDETTKTAGEGEAETEGEKSTETTGEMLPKVESINECSTCHQKKFCIDCHGGVPMPHPSDFKARHGKLGKEVPEACAKCHGSGGEGCNSCHHGTEIDYDYNPAVPWRTAHPAAVNSIGAAGCLEKCHNPTYCSNCHVNGGVPPK